jgi:F0F1-type ATP synthase membrane subunit c/vacuolar-type H+-ATPase subunit K
MTNITAIVLMTALVTGFAAFSTPVPQQTLGAACQETTCSNERAFLMPIP